MPNPEDKEAEEMAKAYIASRTMEHTRSYLERGRQYQALDLDELQAKWVVAGEAFLGRDDQSRVREFKDLNAEYRLRKLDLPSHLLQPSIDASVARIKAYSTADLNHFHERLERFVDDLDKPKN